jgi:hypothetical protein
MNIGKLVKWELAGETKTLEENVPQCHFSATNPAWPTLGSNPAPHIVNPVTSSLSYNMAH